MARLFWITCVGGALWASPGLAQDRLGGPAMGDSELLEDHHAGSEDIHEHHAASEDIHDRQAHSHGPGGYEASSEDIHDHEGDFEQLSDHQGRSSEIQNLGDAEQQDEQVERETMAEMRARHRSEELAEPAAEPTPANSGAHDRMNGQIASVHSAKADLEAAKSRVEQADSVYGQMLERKYPRGEARLKIVDERKLAHQDLARAEQAYDEALGGGGPASN